MSGYGDMVKGAFASKKGVKTRNKKAEAAADLVITEMQESQLSVDHVWVNEGEARIAELEAKSACSKEYVKNLNLIQDLNLILDEAIARNNKLQGQLKSQKMHYGKLKNRLSNMRDEIDHLKSHSDAILHSTICIALFAIFEFIVIMLS